MTKAGHRIAVALDVERLAQALRMSGLWPRYPEFTRMWRVHAEKIAAAYADLASADENADPR